MKRKTSDKTGTARMKELGYAPMQLWLPPELKRLLEREAKRTNQPKTRYALEAIALALAQAAINREGATNK